MENPFRLFISTNENSHKKYIYLNDTDDVPNGYKELKDFTYPIKKLSRKTKIRIQPYFSEISQKHFLENIDTIDFSDIIKTQSWANNLTDEVKVALKLKEENINSSRQFQINEENFMSNIVNLSYFIDDNTGDPIVKFDDIESLDIKITYYYDLAFSFIVIGASDIRFYNNDKIRKIIRDDNYYDSNNFSLGLGHTLTEYFYGDALKKYPVVNMEFLLTPAMIFTAEFYEKLKDKIRGVVYKVDEGENSW
jgi:hypothetical protein